MKEQNTPKDRPARQTERAVPRAVKRGSVAAGRVGWSRLRSGALIRRALIPGGLLALSLLAGAPAQAQPLDSVSREAATALAIAGLEAYEAGHYEEALDKLEKSYTVARVPTLGLWSARALQKLGRWLEAEARYQETVALPLPEVDTETQQQALQAAQSELAALSPTIPQVTLQLEGATLEQLRVTIDGKVINSTEPLYRLNPGTHHIEGDRGDARQAVDIQLAPRDQRTIQLRFPSRASAALPPPSFELEDSGESDGTLLRAAGWTSLVLGGAGLAVGTVSLVLAVQKKDEIDHNDRCRDGNCGPSQQSLVDSYDARRNLSTAGFVAGTALVALGVTALVLAGDGSESPTAEAFISPSFTGIRGTF